MRVISNSAARTAEVIIESLLDNPAKSCYAICEGTIIQLYPFIYHRSKNMDNKSISKRGANLPRRTVSADPHKVFTSDEIRSLLKTSAEVGKDLDMIIELSLLTGVRINELVNIRFDDVDFKNRNITIANEGKRFGKRLLPVGSRAVQILRYLQQSYEKPVPYSIQTLQRSLARGCEANGVKGSFHVLRRSAYAWYYVYGRIPSSIIAGVFGHSANRMDTTMSAWLDDSAAQELFRRAQDKLASLLH